MAQVDDQFTARWRSAFYTFAGGVAKFIQQPVCVAEVRRGRFNRRHAPWPDDADVINAVFAGFPTEQDTPWQAFWTPFEEYVQLPSVKSCDLEQDFSSNGISRCTLAVDNTLMREANGFAGIYHLIERGALSPWRGYQPPNRPSTGVAPNEWFERIRYNAQVRVWQGYHIDEMFVTFTGMVDDIDLTSRPDQVTLAVRDFGQVLIDETVFGWSKTREIRDPIVFADRAGASTKTRTGSGASASSQRSDHPASYVQDNDRSTKWWSVNHGTADVTEWVQIKVPRGLYSSIALDTSGYPGMEAYIGVRPAGGSFEGSSVVPGATNGGWNYVKKIGSTTDGEKVLKFGQTFDLPDNSIIRVGFRKLHKVTTQSYRAAVTGLKAIKETPSQQAQQGRWILVDDAADVVRIVLRWCGFKEWIVEDTGMRLKDKTIYNRQTTKLEIINQVCEKTGFIFYIGDPTPDDLSIGVPVFRQNSSLIDLGDVEQIRDTDLMTGIQVKVSEEPLSYLIRVRGAQTANGHRLGGGPEPGARSLKRYMATYRPPWSGAVGSDDWKSNGGVIKRAHINRFDLKSDDDCTFACMLLALQEALESVAAVVETPGNPSFSLDDHVGLVDTGTGLNTRMWVSARSSRFVGGKNASWKTTLSGTLIDTPWVIGIRDDLREFRASQS